jgi:hypothetical protein
MEVSDKIIMKIFKTLIPFIAFAGLILAACDKLSQPYATIASKFDTIGKPIVLLEEHTGQQCVNCLSATVKAEALATYYSGHVILMAEHGTQQAWRQPPLYLLVLGTAEDSTKWMPAFGIGYVPLGVVNRVAYKSVYGLMTGDWGNAIAAEMSKPVKSKLKVDNAYVADSRLLTVNVTTWFKTRLSGDVNICLYLLEDSIVGRQANTDPLYPRPNVYPYYFRNVFRRSMNGAWGELLVSSADTGKLYNYTKSMALDTAWDETHVFVVALITDLSNNPNGEVIGVAKVPVKLRK